MTIRVLMHRTNPKGRKLEDLLADLIHDLTIKNAELAPAIQRASDQGQDDYTATLKKALWNNEQVVSMLQTARVRQLDTMQRFDAMGPDQGPTGKPRTELTPAEIYDHKQPKPPESDPVAGDPAEE
jgi:hypothetical protein